MGQRFDLAIVVTATGATIATTAASASVAIPNSSSGEKPRYIRIAATAPACVRLGIAGVTAVTTDTQIQPGDAVIFAVPLGYTTIAAIQVSGPGVVQISALENM
jgi:hypothetical protein